MNHHHATVVERSDLAFVRDEVAALLAESESEWTQQEDDANCWKATFSDAAELRCELTALLKVEGENSQTPKVLGVEVWTPLNAGERELSSTSEKALNRFLLAANKRLRLAQIELRSPQEEQPPVAVVTSFATAENIETDIPQCIAAVVAASAVVRAEVAALHDESLASLYLEVTEMSHQSH